jgi:PKD repeat protein
MKRFYTCLVLIAIIVISCQKSSSDTAKSVTSPTPVVTPVAPLPTANFKINNEVSPGNVWEAQTLDVVNSSQNGVSYLWDFGNGTTSTDKTPSNFSLAPCGLTYIVTLTVKNKDGQSATYSARYFVYCSRGMGFGAHGDKH